MHYIGDQSGIFHNVKKAIFSLKRQHLASFLKGIVHPEMKILASFTHFIIFFLTIDVNGAHDRFPQNVFLRVHQNKMYTGV